MNSPNTIQGNGATRYKMEERPTSPVQAKLSPKAIIPSTNGKLSRLQC